MKKLLYFCCAITITKCKTPEPEIPVPSKTVIKQTVIQTLINQRSAVDKQPIHLFGKKLNSYLNNLDTTTFKAFFPQLPLRAKIMYLLTINIDQYEQFLERYTNEEWTNFWHQSSIEEQKHLPKTRPEQLSVIRDAYYTYIEKHSSMFFPYFNPKSPYPSDIEIFKKKFYVDEGISMKPNDMHAVTESAKQLFLEAYMLRKRYELFNL